MDTDAKKLVKQLKQAGLSDQAIKAAWPTWWDENVASSASARAELRFALSRKLGLAPQSLLGERVEFVWDRARFKNLTAGEQLHRGILSSFGVAVGRLLLRATPAVASLEGISASGLRQAILKQRSVVDLVGLLSACWALGVPTIHLRVFPLHAKSMRAMVVEVKGRFAILLGRDAYYPAPIAFTLAHEIGHIAQGHLGTGQALIDVGNPLANSDDAEERAADRFGLELLTGSPSPEIITNTEDFSARALARACMDVGPARHIEPGTLALCVGYLQNNWSAGNGALRHVYTDRKPVWQEVNGLAERLLGWDELGEESASYLHSIMGGNDQLADRQ